MKDLFGREYTNQSNTPAASNTYVTVQTPNGPAQRTIISGVIQNS